MHSAALITSHKGYQPFPTGRLPSSDPRNDNFLLRSVQPLMAAAVPSIPSKMTLALTGRWDQTIYPACVGFTALEHLACYPAKRGLVGLDGLGLYQAAQEYDEWPGTGYDGSSVNGVLKFLLHHQRAKDIKEYRWAHKVEEINLHISQRIHSGVLMGTNWYPSMFYPSAEGIVKVGNGAPSGHAYYRLGYDLKRGLCLYQNHWKNPDGRWWGQGGRFWMQMEDEQRLLDEDGEAGVTLKYQKGE